MGGLRKTVSLACCILLVHNYLQRSVSLLPSSLPGPSSIVGSFRFDHQFPVLLRLHQPICSSFSHRSLFAYPNFNLPLHHPARFLWFAVHCGMCNIPEILMGLRRPNKQIRINALQIRIITSRSLRVECLGLRSTSKNAPRFYHDHVSRVHCLIPQHASTTGVIQKKIPYKSLLRGFFTGFLLLTLRQVILSWGVDCVEGE